MVFKVAPGFLTFSLLVVFFALEVHSLSLLDVAEYELRILNGHKASVGKYLTQVSLQRRNSKGRFSHFCGGSILNSGYVLTAAHCVHDDVAKDLRVVSATKNLRKKGRAYKVSSIICHKNYTEKFSIKMGVYVLNDIALLKVSPEFRLRTREASVTLPYRSQKFSRGEVATVVGWGAINETVSYPGKLYEVDIFLVGPRRCEKLYGSDGVIHRRQHICAGVLPKGDRGDCKGDGGGPLFVRGVQVGVVSFGSGPCGVKPGVYTKLSHFLPWIKRHAV